MYIGIIMIPTSVKKAFEKLGFMLNYKTGPKTHILIASVLPHVTYPFHSDCRKDVQCSVR